LKSTEPLGTSPRTGRIAIVGAGRVGTAVAGGLRGAGRDVVGPLGRDYPPGDLAGATVVLLCVPDTQITPAAAVLGERLPAGAVAPLAGHCSGATDLAALAGHEGFSMHPLMTVGAPDPGFCFAGAGAAVAGATPRALLVAR
jgi:hypothetical protein